MTAQHLRVIFPYSCGVRGDMQACFGLEHPRVAAGLHNLAALLQAQGKHEESDRLQT